MENLSGMPRLNPGLVKRIQTITAETKGSEVGASFALQFAAMSALALAPAIAA